MNALVIWFFGAVLEETTRQTIKRLFKNNLDKRLWTTAERWQNNLPEVARLFALEALFPKSSPSSMENPPPQPAQILTKLEKAALPDTNDWTEALLQQWQWVRKTEEEPQEFFLLHEDRARVELAELGKLLALECEKDRELFQCESLKLQREHSQGISDLLEKQQENHLEVMASLNNNGAVIGSMTEGKDVPAGRYHAEIDAAVVFTKQGQPDVALAQLDQLRIRYWNTLNDRERFRVVANIGHAYNAKDQYSEAARHFIDCQQFQPKDEQARCLAAIGHLMLEEYPLAFKLAAGICEDFPNSDLAHAIWVRSAPINMSFEDVEAEVPSQLRSAIDTAFALSWRALHTDDLTLAESYARTALTHDEKNRHLLEQLGVILFESGRREAASQYTESPQLTASEKMCEAKSLFEQLIEKNLQTLPIARARIRFCLGRVCQLLEEWEEACEHLQAAFDSDKNNPQYARLFALILYDRKQEDRAIKILRSTIDHDESRYNLTLLAHLLSLRNGLGDCDEAIRMLSEQMTQLEELESYTRSEIVATLIDLYCQTDRVLEAAEALDKLPRGVLAPETYNIIQALRLRRTGDIGGAKIKAKESVQQITSGTDHREQRRVAVELVVLGLFEEALPIWKQLVEPRYLGLHTSCLLRCAEECDDAKFIIEFCAELRKNGIVDRDIFHLEIDTLQKYHCLNRAVEAMHKYLQSAPETPLTREIRVRLSHLAIIIGRDDLVEYDPERLPSVSVADPHLGLVVVEVLSHGPMPINGVQYAYKLLRRHFDSELAHKAMVVSFLLGYREHPTPQDPDVAGAGTAVRYKEDDSDAFHWHIIEDSVDPNQALYEYPANHGISKALIGKNKGEQFYLRKDNIQKRTATIVDVWSKYKLRFNLCMQEWENRFPETCFLYKFSVKKDAHDKANFDAILKTVDQRSAEIHEREDIYRYNPLSVTNFAVMMHSSVLDALQHLGSKSDLPIRCCRGTDEEYASADAALAKEVPLLLDGSALASLFVTRTYHPLSNLGIPLVVSEGTLQECRRRYIEKLNSPRESKFLTKDGDQYILVNESPEALRQRLGEYREFLETIQSVAQVEEGMPLCELSRKTRETMIQLVGRPAAETIAIARSKRFVLWTDDMCVADLAAEHGSIPRVWTDAIARWGYARGNIPSEVRNDLVLSLVCLGYFYTRIDTEVALWAGERSEWDITDKSLESLLDWFSNPYTKWKGIVALAGKLLPEISQISNQFRADVVTTKLLMKISQRRDGTMIINELLRIGVINEVTATSLRLRPELWLPPR